jgi:threonyl-tRNA synthetase
MDKNNEQKEQLEHKRHTLAHLLAAAVLELYPDAKPTIGPVIDNGFYYDFEFPTTKPTEKEMKDIEKKMRKLLPSWKDMTGAEASADEARKLFKDNAYKLELVNDLDAKKEKITLYTAGDSSNPAGHKFTDLCRGGHVENPAKDIASDSFKISRLAGAYWRGDEKNAMLSRIYGIAFNTKEELDAYENMMKEAEKRDHKKLGKELKLFTTSALVGSGLPLLQPKGMIIRTEIEDYLWELHKDHGYQRVWTPHIAKEDLYITSGHAAKFGDEIFRVQGKEEKFFLKPMNCPHHMQIFADNQFSYRDMPVRYFEPATVYRDEKSGQLSGLTRVRSITQDDGHLFCRKSQINEEVATIIGIIKTFYTTMNMLEGYWVRLSTRGENKSAYIGSDEVWGIAEKALQDAAVANKLNWKLGPGEAAFYGPKLDFMFKDAIGREWQLATIQCDFNLPERFDLSFVNEKSEKERPVVIHRAISGSLERFMGIIIEHYAGNFPLWMSPVQVKVIPVAEAFFEAAQKIECSLHAGSIRTEIDLSNDSFGKKIRSAKTSHAPYYIIIGEKDMAAGKVTLESRDLSAAQAGKGQIGQLTIEEVLKRFQEEIKERK